MPFTGRENTASGLGEAVKLAVHARVVKVWNLVSLCQSQSVPTSFGKEN